ncbi:MAG TPA: hypothetical protein VIP11_19305 [Gemmatimonadaceae bacterium]
MPTARRQKQYLPFHPNERASVEARFPSAIAGEEYARYARAMRVQADEWFRRHSGRIAAPDLSMHEARDILWSVAATDLTRRLYPQEERLLSDLLQKAWPARAAELAQIEPEIPSFLLKGSRSNG